MNLDINKIAVFDIETVGGWSTLDDLNAEDPKLAELWSDRCEFLRKRYDNNEDMTDEELWETKSALHAEFSKVACVSFGIVKPEGNVIKSKCSKNEIEVLEFAAHLLGNADRLGLKLAGHTIERFDIPFLWKRMLINGIKPPSIITAWDKKPWDLNYFDVAKFWSGGAWQEGFTSLDTMATLFGMPSPKETIKAKDVHNVFWKDGDLDGIQRYCEGDVHTTINVISRLADTVK